MEEIEKYDANKFYREANSEFYDKLNNMPPLVDYGYNRCGFNPLTMKYSTSRIIFNVGISILTLGLAIPVLNVIAYLDINQSPILYSNLKELRENSAT